MSLQMNYYLDSQHRGLEFPFRDSYRSQIAFGSETTDDGSRWDWITRKQKEIQSSMSDLKPSEILWWKLQKDWSFIVCFLGSWHLFESGQKWTQLSFEFQREIGPFSKRFKSIADALHCFKGRRFVWWRLNTLNHWITFISRMEYYVLPMYVQMYIFFQNSTTALQEFLSITAKCRTLSCDK